jgi:hypothetical protein
MAALLPRSYHSGSGKDSRVRKRGGGFLGWQVRQFHRSTCKALDSEERARSIGQIVQERSTLRGQSAHYKKREVDPAELNGLSRNTLGM